MDSFNPSVERVLNSFTTIPISNIYQLLVMYNHHIFEDEELNYQNALKLILTQNLSTVPALIFIDWITAYRLAVSNANIPQINISNLLKTSDTILQTLAQLLSLPEANKERIIRILRFLGVLNDDINLFTYLPDDLLLQTLDYFECEDIPLICDLSPEFHRLCDNGKVTNLMRKRVTKQLGLNTDRYDMDQLSKLCKVRRGSNISAGRSHSLFLTSSGQVYSVGSNNDGQLGLHDYKDRNTPQLIPNINNIVSISAGTDHSLLLDRDGHVHSFGKLNGKLNSKLNSKHRVGRDANIPILIPELKDIVSISAGGSHSLALDVNGKVYLYTDNSDAFIPITYVNDVVGISAGENHSLLLTLSGNVYAMGDNSHGQLGLGDTNNRSVFELVDTMKNIVSISAGGSHSLLLNSIGNVFAAGSNQYFQLGINEYTFGYNDNTSYFNHVRFPSLFKQTTEIPYNMEIAQRIISISAGYNHSLVLTWDNRVYAFGSNTNGQLGKIPTMLLITHRNPPKLISIDQDIGSISAGHNFSLISDVNDNVYSFGLNNLGQLGLDDNFDRNIPTLIPNLHL